MRDLLALPKVELHIHLEGAMRVETALDLAGRQGLPVPSGLVDGSWRFDGFLDFIDQCVALCALLNAPDDFRRLAYEMTQDLSRNGVRYAEAVFSPSNHAARLRGDWIGPIEAVLDGLEAGARDFGTTVRLTPDIVRDLGLEQAQRVPTLSDHPFMRLRAEGVIVTLNSDDPPMFGDAWVGRVYEAARDAWGPDDTELAQIARAGVGASFADVAVKREIGTAIDR